MPNVAINQGGTAGTASPVAGIAGHIIRVKAFQGAISATGTIQFKSSGGTVLTGAINLVTGTPYVVPDAGANNDGWFESLVGEGINLVSVTGGFNGSLTYQVV